MNFYKFYNILESMDVRVKDAEYKNPLNDILSVCQYLSDSVYKIFTSFNEEQKSYYSQNRVPELIAPDGNDYFQEKGIINFYLKPIHPSLTDKFIKAIKYYLQEANIKYGQFYEEDSKSMASRVIRIPILQLPEENKDHPPEINLSNGNAHLIFTDVLGFKGIDDYHYLISARDLLMKIDNLPDFVADANSRDDSISYGSGGSQFISFGYSGDQIRQRLEQIRKVAIWAIENHYDTIQVV